MPPPPAGPRAGGPWTSLPPAAAVGFVLGLGARRWVAVAALARPRARWRGIPAEPAAEAGLVLELGARRWVGVGVRR